MTRDSTITDSWALTSSRRPHLDALASEGIVFPYTFNTASHCLPSLRSLLTGLHPLQFEARESSLYDEHYQSTWMDALRARDDGKPPPPPDQSRTYALRRIHTLPSLLSRAGYASFQGGKLWDGGFKDAGFTHGLANASTESELLVGAKGGVRENASLALGRTTMQPLWDFIDAHRDQPFFIWFAPMLPHLPHDPPPSFRNTYYGRGLSGSAIKYYGNISRLDARVGELVHFLDSRELRKRTLIVFLADNGWVVPTSQKKIDHQLGGPGGKLSHREFGFRTPLIVSWPDRIPKGKRYNDLVSTVDLFPTLLDLVGVAVPRDRPGKTLLPRLLGTGPATRKWVFSELTAIRLADTRVENGVRYMTASETLYTARDRKWRYVHRPEKTGQDELYRIDTDPMETTNVIADHPKMRNRYREAAAFWRDVMVKATLGVPKDELRPEN